VGLDYELTPSLKLGLEGGRIESAGSFSANFYGLSLGIAWANSPQASAGAATGHQGVRLAKWRLVGVHQTNFAAARKNGTNRT